MSFVAALLVGASVTLITVALWPRRAERFELQLVELVEDPRVPRTLH